MMDEKDKIKLPPKPRRASVPEGLRASNEDDDGYDPYPDYMDALSRSDYEEPCEDPWR
jgi:hypothetical protein